MNAVSSSCVLRRFLTGCLHVDEPQAGNVEVIVIQTDGNGAAGDRFFDPYGKQCTLWTASPAVPKIAGFQALIGSPYPSSSIRSGGERRQGRMRGRILVRPS